MYVRGNKLGEWVVMYMYVRGNKLGEWVVMYMFVRCNKLGEWVVMYMYVRVNKLGEWQPLTYLFFPYCISLIYFSFNKIHMFLYAQMYWLAEFGDISCLQFNYLRVETHTLTLTPTWEDFVRRICRTILRVTLSSSPTKLCVRPESMIVDALGGNCTLPATSALSKK